MPRCRLCHSRQAIENSHLIPKFAVDWLKETSATGYLRMGKTPNLRKQDGVKLPLLCLECEGRFARFEKAFAEEVWRPAKAGHLGPFIGIEEYRTFAVSLAWRTAIASLHFSTEAAWNQEVAEDALRHQAAVEAACRDWTKYLLGESPSPGEYTSHVFFLGEATHIPDDARALRFHAYTMRSIDATMGYGRERAISYALLPGMMFWTNIVPADVLGNVRTRIAADAVFGGTQSLRDDLVGSFLLHRIQVTSEMTPLSVKQKRRVIETMLKDPERAWYSESHRAAMADSRFKPNIAQGDGAEAP